MNTSDLFLRSSTVIDFVLSLQRKYDSKAVKSMKKQRIAKNVMESIRTLEADNETLANQVTAKDKAYKKLKKELAAKDGEIEELKTEVTNKDADIAAKDGKIERLLTDVTDKAAENATIRQDNRNLNRKLNDFETKFDNLKNDFVTKFDNLKIDLAGLRSDNV